MYWRPPTTAWLISQRHKNTSALIILGYQERKDCLIYVSMSEKVKQKNKMPQSFLGKGVHMLGYVCQQVGPHCLGSLISSNMFLTHTESSSAQIISPSAVKSFQFSALTSEASSPSRKPRGSMFHPLCSSESLILLLHSLGLGSQNISRTFIPLFLFYYFPCCLFPTSQDLKEKPIPKEMSQFPFYTCQVPFNPETSGKTCKPKISLPLLPVPSTLVFLFACRIVQQKKERGWELP